MRKTMSALLVGAALVSTGAHAAAPAPAALVSDIEGRVLINRGQGFEQISQSVSLRAGDRVYVRKDGSATVKYLASDCEVILTEASMTTIDDKGPCAASGGGLASFFGAAISPAQGEPDPTVTGAIIVAGVAAVALAVILLLDDDKKSRPVSPP